MALLVKIKRWMERRRQELAAHRAMETQLDTLTDKGFFDRVGK